MSGPPQCLFTSPHMLLQTRPAPTAFSYFFHLLAVCAEPRQVPHRSITERMRRERRGRASPKHCKNKPYCASSFVPRLRHASYATLLLPVPAPGAAAGHQLRGISLCPPLVFAHGRTAHLPSFWGSSAGAHSWRGPRAHAPYVSSGRSGDGLTADRSPWL